MTTTYLDILRCPNCAVDFSTAFLSSTTFWDESTELRPIALGGDPERFAVHCCTDCGYSGEEEDFAAAVPPEVSARIARVIRPLLPKKQRPRPKHLPSRVVPSDQAWYFAALIAEWRGERPERVAQRCLSAAWSSEPGLTERLLRVNAARWFEDSLPGLREGRATWLYRLGEIHRRLGDDRAAGRWFDAAIAEAEADPSDARVGKLALQQKTAPRDTI